MAQQRDPMLPSFGRVLGISLHMFYPKHPHILTMYLYSLGTETPKLQSPILAFKTYQLLYCLLFFVWESQNSDRKCLNLIKEARTKRESKSRKTNHDKLMCELIFLNDDYASVTNFSTTPATEQLSHQRRCTHKYVHYCPQHLNKAYTVPPWCSSTPCQCALCRLWCETAAQRSSSPQCFDPPVSQSELQSLSRDKHNSICLSLT